VLTTKVTDFDAAIGFFENRDDLCLGESTFFHSGISSDPYNLYTLFIPCRAIGEVDTRTGMQHYPAHVTCSRRTSSSRDQPPVGCLVVRSDDLRGFDRGGKERGLRRDYGDMFSCVLRASSAAWIRTASPFCSCWAWNFSMAWRASGSGTKLKERIAFDKIIGSSSSR